MPFSKPFASFAPHFSYKELTNTSTGFENEPKDLKLCHLRALSWILEDIRSNFGHPIYINSGYRSHEVNQAVGGVMNSMHCFGRAVDISVAKYCNADKKELERCILARKPSEFIKYDTFWHVAFDIYTIGPTKKPSTYAEKYPDTFEVAEVRSARLGEDDV